VILILKHKWFDMIASGVKREEYRALTPHYKRMLTRFNMKDPKDRVIEFRCGYTKTAVKVRGMAWFIMSEIDLEVCRSMGREFRPEWGYDGSKRLIVIALGEIVK